MELNMGEFRLARVESYGAAKRTRKDVKHRCRGEGNRNLRRGPVDPPA
jgi:hypothetical protein